MVDVNLHCCHHAQEDLNSCVKLEFALVFCIVVLFVIVLVEIEHRQSTPSPSNYSQIFTWMACCPPQQRPRNHSHDHYGHSLAFP